MNVHEFSRFSPNYYPSTCWTLIKTLQGFSRCTLHSSLKCLAKKNPISQQLRYQQQLIHKHNLKEVSITNMLTVWPLLLQCFPHDHHSEPDLGSTMGSGHRWNKFNEKRSLLVLHYLQFLSYSVCNKLYTFFYQTGRNRGKKLPSQHI